MATSKKESSAVSKQDMTSKEAPKVKAPAKKATATKKATTAKKVPSFVSKEVLVLNGKECVFVEKLKGKIVVRFEDGTYSSSHEEDFTAK